MEEIDLAPGAAAALILGILAHQFYFRKGEHHMYSVLYVQIFTAAYAGSIFALNGIYEFSISRALMTVSTFAVSWLVGVYSSLLIYRLFFHPLKDFPGPIQARISSLWFTANVKNHDDYRVIHQLHQKYGKIVRIGSNDLSIIDPNFAQMASTIRKGDWYDGSEPHHSMHTTRDKALHDRRRRVWAPAFSDKALREYEVTVHEFNDKFVQRIGEFCGGVVDATKWFNLYGFDVMGRLAFGKDYHMLDRGERHWALELLTKGMETASGKPPIWLFRILLAVPGLATGYFQFLKFCADELKWRVENKTESSSKDITGWLLKAYRDQPHPERDPMLQGDARLIIVAGSDTTSATLTHLFFHLAKDPAQVKRLRDELRPLTSGDWSDKDIQHAAHLNGAINEALRLHPPVPSGLHRLTPPEGMRAGETFIPGGVQFWMPQYSIGRDEDTYESASSFVPERWYSRPEMIKHSDAFAPFSMGPYNCIGRNLARIELRTLTAQLILAYDVALAPNEDGTRLLTKTKDHFTVSPGQLDLVVSPATS